MSSVVSEKDTDGPGDVEETDVIIEGDICERL